METDITTQDKLKVIAEYDGWELRGEPEFIPPYKIWVKHLPQGQKMIPYMSPSGKEYDDWFKELKYLTSMDWLHPVAMDVLDGLRNVEDDRENSLSHLRSSISSYCGSRPDKGEYIDLFNSVYDGIIFLNSNK